MEVNVEYPVDWIIDIILPYDRNQYGELYFRSSNGLYTLFGPVPVLGRSVSNGSPLEENGNTPTGTYRAFLKGPREVSPRYGKPYGDVRRPSGGLSFGNTGVIALIPETGQAKDAAARGRNGLLIHEGGLGPNGGLAYTHGCPRVFPYDMGSIVAAIAAINRDFRDNYTYVPSFIGQIRQGEVRVFPGVPLANPASDEQTFDPAYIPTGNETDAKLKEPDYSTSELTHDLLSAEAGFQYQLEDRFGRPPDPHREQAEEEGRRREEEEERRRADERARDYEEAIDREYQEQERRDRMERYGDYDREGPGRRDWGEDSRREEDEYDYKQGPGYDDYEP